MRRHWYEEIIEEAEKGLDDVQAGRLKSVAELRARYRRRGAESLNILPPSVDSVPPITPDDDPASGRSQ